MADLVVPNLKPDPEPCCCGCGRVAALRSKPWRDGSTHVRTCECARCRGARNRRQGLRKQKVAQKALGVPQSRYGDTNEERWGDNVFANETKSGAQVGPVANFWTRTERQVMQNRSDFGSDLRPARIVAMPAGWGDDGVVLVRLSTWRTHVRPALDEFYGPEAS